MDRAMFRELLAEGPIVADGGLGTSLIALGAQVDACFELLNVTEPALVEQVHRSFTEAGARLLLTNSFGANRFRLERHGLDDRVAELCAASVERAREAGDVIATGTPGATGSVPRLHTSAIITGSPAPHVTLACLIVRSGTAPAV